MQGGHAELLGQLGYEAQVPVIPPPPGRWMLAHWTLGR